MFIKLHSVFIDSIKYINPALIIGISEEAESGFTIVYVTEQSFCVKETPEEILKLIKECEK